MWRDPSVLGTSERSLVFTAPSSADARAMLAENLWVSGMAMRTTSADGRAKPLARRRCRQRRRPRTSRGHVADGGVEGVVELALADHVGYRDQVRGGGAGADGARRALDAPQVLGRRRLAQNRTPSSVWRSKATVIEFSSAVMMDLAGTFLPSAV